MAACAEPRSEMKTRESFLSPFLKAEWTRVQNLIPFPITEAEASEAFDEVPSLPPSLPPYIRPPLDFKPRPPPKNHRGIIRANARKRARAQYAGLLRDPSRIWCYAGQARLGAVFHIGSLKCVHAIGPARTHKRARGRRPAFPSVRDFPRRAARPGPSPGLVPVPRRRRPGGKGLYACWTDGTRGAMEAGRGPGRARSTRLGPGGNGPPWHR